MKLDFGQASGQPARDRNYLGSKRDMVFSRCCALWWDTDVFLGGGRTVTGAIFKTMFDKPGP